MKQAAIIASADYLLIRSQIRKLKYKILLDLAWYTGERWASLVQIKVADIYEQDGTPKEFIATSQIKIKELPPQMQKLLATYKPEIDSPWLFPGRKEESFISLRWADKILHSAVTRAGLADKGITLHSTRRTFREFNKYKKFFLAA